VYPSKPSPDPRIDTLIDPVLAPFEPSTPLSPILSIDAPNVKLPSRTPTLIEPRWLPRTPCSARHRTVVSDSHSVPSHAVRPTRTAPLRPSSPNPPPCTVIDNDPVPARLDRLTPLDEPYSNEYPAETLPTRTPALITTARLPPDPSPNSPAVDVSESHSVPSHPVPPTRNPPLLPASPIPDPCTVTRAEPVPAPFALLTPLSPAGPIVYATLTLPTRPPTLTLALQLPPTPCPPAMHRTDVSDTHSDPSDDVGPKRTNPVKDSTPTPPPCTVTLIDPVAAPLVRCSTLNPEPTPAEKPKLMLPARPPTVTDSFRLPPAPSPLLHRIDVSDSHPVPSQPVTPPRTAPVAIADPIPAPCTVTLDDPVDPTFARLVELPVPPSIDIPRVRLPPTAPTLATTRRLPDHPCPALHTTLLSDTQSVPSHTLPATRPDPVLPHSPKLDPRTVTLADPLPALFTCIPPLAPPTSNDTANVTLPTPRPTLNTPRRLPDTPLPACPRTDVSDSQLVASHPVPPVRPATEYPASPTMPP
jgi:hypothetical protein